MLNITVESTRAELRTLSPRKIIGAEVKAINKTARGLRTQISKRVRKDVAIKASTVKDSLSIQKARRRPQPVAVLDVDPKPIPLKHYGARQVRKGVSVRVKKAGGRKLVKSAFIVKKYGSHVYQRKGKARLPLKRLLGPSVRNIVEPMRSDLEHYIKKTLDKQIKQAIEWEILKESRRNL